MIIAEIFTHLLCMNCAAEKIDEYDIYISENITVSLPCSFYPSSPLPPSFHFSFPIFIPPFVSFLLPFLSSFPSFTSYLSFLPLLYFIILFPLLFPFPNFPSFSPIPPPPAPIPNFLFPKLNYSSIPSPSNRICV